MRPKEQSTDIGLLHEQREALKAYLDSKVAIEDWHGVRDAASDLEMVDVRIELLGLIDE